MPTRRSGFDAVCQAAALSVTLVAGLLAAPAAENPLPDLPASTESLLRYGERPLTAEDFRGPIPQRRPEAETRIEAYSHTVLRYHYETRTRRRGTRWQVELAEIEVYAALDRDKSWNAQPENPAQLDHHQGHFDLAQITALTLREDLAERRRTRRLPVGQGKTEREAVADLERQVAEIVRGHDEALQREHKYFDQITLYGTLPDVEARERAKQQQTLRSKQSPR